MKYQNGKVYKILNSETDDVYVGSTTQKLSKRMTNHRTKLKPGRILRLYEKMREIGEDKFYIEPIEEYPCQNSEQLLKREGEWMRQIGTLNENVPGRNNKQYKQEHKENIKEREKHITKKTKNKYYKDKKNTIKKTKKRLMNDIKNTTRNTKKK